MNTSLKEHLAAFAENAVDVISEEELSHKLSLSFKEKRPLRLKIGFDPTARDIHLGHTVLLRRLRKLQDMGYEVYFIVGDFTAQIGDPSGRSELRPMLSRQEIEDNARTYTEQAFRILDETKTTVVFNSGWFNEMKTAEFISLLSRYTVARMIERDDFSARLKMNKPLSMQELIYPLIQGYDSVKIEADVEFGGTDQKFNLIVGRHLQESFGQSAQCVITFPLLVGLDGVNKMSKSLGNYVGVTENAQSMFGKLMSISDELMFEYARLLTDLDPGELKKMHPKEAKLLLSQTITGFYHGSDTAVAARQEFERVFSKGELPEYIPEYVSKTVEVDVVEVLYKSKLVASKNEARRLLDQNGISIDGITVVTPRISIPPKGLILKAGKRRFLKILPRK